MISNIFVLLFAVSVVSSQNCYWNDGCAYELFSSKTPYDAVRGDIRDYPTPQNCKAVSLWSLNRHGNRNPGSSVTNSMRTIAGLKNEIISSFDDGRGQLCAQDVENLKKWTWNDTLDVSQSHLTGIGYEELYNIGKRLREKYPHLLEGTAEDFYFRATDEQRTVTSSIAFVHGWSETTNLSLSIDGPWPRDDVIRPYENCDRYQQEVEDGPTLQEQMNAYFRSQEFITVQNDVQNRLGILTLLSADDVYSLYEICRFYRTWEPTLKSPWCAAFSNEDLVVLEYSEDVRHYYRNGYGSWVNTNLGSLVMKDLFEKFDTFVQYPAQRKNAVAYFTHDTMIEMAACAIGLKMDDAGVVVGNKRDPNRQWRSSQIGCYSANILAVLNSCEESGNQSYQVQLFLNEKPTHICPVEGCPWQEFKNKFQTFTTANLQLCTLDPRETELDLPGGAPKALATRLMLIASAIVGFLGWS